MSQMFVIIPCIRGLLGISWPYLEGILGIFWAYLGQLWHILAHSDILWPTLAYSGILWLLTQHLPGLGVDDS